MFLASSRSDLSESLLITTLLGIPLGEPDGKTPIVVPPCDENWYPGGTPWGEYHHGTGEATLVVSGDDPELSVP